MKAAIYTRVSTDVQAEVEFNSCEAQEQKIRSFIDSQEKMRIYKVYSDQGYTGANTDRPALKEMLFDIQQGKIDIVISYKIDRLTRSPKDFYQLIEIFEKHNVSFLSITERFDTSTPSGRLLRNIMLTFAQFERELISERIRDKIAERAKKGMWSSGKAPFGYKKQDKKLAIEPREAAIVKTAFESFIAYPSLFALYNKLKEANMLNRSGLPLSKTSLDFMLKSIVYTGMVKHNGAVYQGIHDPIVSKVLYDEVQQLRKDKVRPKKSISYNYSLFPGLVRCKECGSVMSATFANKLKDGERTRYFYYRCTVVEKRDISFCSIRQVSADRLDSFIVDNLDKIRKNKQYLDSLIYVLNHNSAGSSEGFEPGPSSMPIMVENVQKLLQTIVEASRLKGKTEKRIIIKRHIEKVIYSKETIEVVLLYSDSVSSASVESTADRADAGPSGEDHQLNNGAACRDASAAPSRPTNAIVCATNQMARPVYCRARHLIIPNAFMGALSFPLS
jgi:site-specific DNA recombinase